MTTHNPRPVRIVAGNPIAEHRAHETRLITAVLTGVCALAAGCATVPALDDLVSTIMATLFATLAAAAVLRWVIRRVRWWFEDRADARTADAWRAQHAHQNAQDDTVRAGVA